MRHLHKGSLLPILSWLAIFLAATASADVVEDLVFEPFEAEAAESSPPRQDIENPAENATVPSVGGHVPDVKTAGHGFGFAGSADGIVALSSVFLVSRLVVATFNRTLPPLSARLLPPLRI